MHLLGDSAPVALAIVLTACVGILAAILALQQTGRPALVWVALGIAATAAAVVTVATQRPGVPLETGPGQGQAGPEQPGTDVLRPGTVTPVSPLTGGPEPTTPGLTDPSTGAAAMQPGPPPLPFVRTTVDAATRRTNRDAFRSTALAGFAAPAIDASQTCQGEEPAGGEREVVVCYLPGDHQVRYLRWGCLCDRDRERRRMPVGSSVPSRWTDAEGRYAGALRLGVHDGVEGDYVKVYWDLDCRPVGAILYGPSVEHPSVPDVRRYWLEAVLDRSRTC